MRGHSAISSTPSTCHYGFSAAVVAEKRLRNRAAEGDRAAVLSLLQEGANVNGTNESGETALHLAARAGHLSVIHALKEHGANVSLRDQAGSTALELAVAYRHSHVLSDQIWHGQGGRCVHWTDANQRRLRNRARDGDVAGVRELIAAGVTPTTTDERGMTAVDIARGAGHVGLAIELEEALPAAKAADQAQAPTAGDEAGAPAMSDTKPLGGKRLSLLCALRMVSPRGTGSASGPAKGG